MITPISEQGKAIIRRATDEKSQIPAVLKPYIYTPTQLFDEKSEITTFDKQRRNILQHFK